MILGLAKLGPLSIANACGASGLFKAPPDICAYTLPLPTPIAPWLCPLGHSFSKGSPNMKGWLFGLSPNPAFPVTGVVDENCVEPLRPIDPRVAESLGESPAPVAIWPSMPNSNAPYRFSKFILDRSKLNSAGSLGSKNAPAIGFWL